MKRAIGLIAATLLSTSVYSQDYSSTGSSNPDSTPDYQSRQSEAGAPASSEPTSSSSAGYDKAPGFSGGNSSTGQSSGSNVGSQDQSVTTRDSDVSGSDYRGTPESSETLKGSGTADGAFHEPAAPVRESSTSEGWSSSDTFSGAGPGSISGSATSTNSSVNASKSPMPATESSNSFSADVSNNSALNKRDQDLGSRGLEADSNQLRQSDAFSNSVEGDRNNDTLILEDWTVVTPDSDSNVGAPAESEIGVGSSSDEGSIRGDESYGRDLHQRVQREWNNRGGLMDRSLEDLGQMHIYNDTTQSDVGAPGSSVSGSAKSSDDDTECDAHKEKGSAGDYQQGSKDDSSSEYHINRGEDEKYHLNRSASGDDSSPQTRAPGEYGDRPDSSDYDDGHLKGNNAAGSSSSSESSSSAGNESVKSTDGALTQPDL